MPTPTPMVMEKIQFLFRREVGTADADADADADNKLDQKRAKKVFKSASASASASALGKREKKFRCLMMIGCRC